MAKQWVPDARPCSSRDSLAKTAFYSLVGGDIRAGGNAAAESMCLGHDRPQLFRARQSALTCETYFDQVRS